MQVVLFNALSSEPEDDRCTRLTGVAGGLQVKQWRSSCVFAQVLIMSGFCYLPHQEEQLKVQCLVQIFFFFFGLVIIGVGVMTSSLEGSSFQIGNDSSADEGLPYRFVLCPGCTSIGDRSIPNTTHVHMPLSPS